MTLDVVLTLIVIGLILMVLIAFLLWFFANR